MLRLADVSSRRCSKQRCASLPIRLRRQAVRERSTAGLPETKDGKAGHDGPLAGSLPHITTLFISPSKLTGHAGLRGQSIMHCAYIVVVHYTVCHAKYVKVCARVWWAQS